MDINDMKSQKPAELRGHIETLRDEISRLRIEFRVGNVKDSNLPRRKRRELARALTVLKEMGAEDGK